MYDLSSFTDRLIHTCIHTIRKRNASDRTVTKASQVPIRTGPFAIGTTFNVRRLLITDKVCLHAALHSGDQARFCKQACTSVAPYRQVIRINRSPDTLQRRIPAHTAPSTGHPRPQINVVNLLNLPNTAEQRKNKKQQRYHRFCCTFCPARDSNRFGLKTKTCPTLT